MTLPAWVDNAYVVCPECAGGVYYGVDAETAGLASYGDPETAVFVGA